ncbi:MAG: FecR domain-containing protein [Candidatus Omnitrophica bacterium]|nr:FecR domain-containing protein [Candidatus Omnitrophota bacterium]
MAARPWLLIFGVTVLGSLQPLPAEAQTILPPASPAFPSAPADAARIGVAAAVRGEVKITSREVGRVIQSGEPIYLGDAISTDAKSRLQILLLDETVFTIGPGSSIIIDQFVYDPATRAGKVHAEVVKGTFRFITGKIGRKSPKDMEVKLPVGVIGIRGTMVAGRVEGRQSQVVLLGPGPQNNAGELPGKVVVSNQIGATLHEVVLSRPGFGTTISGVDSIPTPAVRVPPQQMGALTGTLAPDAFSSTETEGPAAPEGQPGTAPQSGPGFPAAPEDGAAPGPILMESSATETSGQGTAVAMHRIADNRNVAGIIRHLNNDADKAVQANAQATAGVADGISQKEQLRSIQTGTFTFSFNGAVGSFDQTRKNGSPVSTIHGIATVNIPIDFGARTLNGTITLNTANHGGDINRVVTISPAISFAAGTGNAVFGNLDPGNVFVGNLTLRNVSGVIAKTATLTGTYDSTPLDGSSSRDEGSIPVPIVMER